MTKRLITAIEGQRMIVEILDRFQEMTAFHNKPTKMFATIANVEFHEFIQLFYRLKTSNKRLFIPGEFCEDVMCFVYTPVPGCTICVEADPGDKSLKETFCFTLN